jgi:hypothetical protein
VKLFIWADPYRVTYGSSLLVAVAETVEEAKEIAQTKAKSYSYGKYENTLRGAGFAIDLGEPTRVVDLPCAEWHEWSE